MSDIVSIAQESQTFKTLVEAVKAANLVDTLKGEGPFTVFAPTNEAFEKALVALNITIDQLLSNTDLLTKVLTYHVIPGKVMAKDVMALADGTEVATVEGSTVKISNSQDVFVNESKVIQTDIEASNGVIHVIDKVLMPK